jgi:hypothetical protein
VSLRLDPGSDLGLPTCRTYLLLLERAFRTRHWRSGSLALSLGCDGLLFQLTSWERLSIMLKSRQCFCAIPLAVDDLKILLPLLPSNVQRRKSLCPKVSANTAKLAWLRDDMAVDYNEVFNACVTPRIRTRKHELKTPGNQLWSRCRDAIVFRSRSLREWTSCLS